MYKFLCERMVSFLLDVHLVLEFWGYMITFIWASLVAQDGKEYACNAGELSSIHGKIPWRREWLPTPVFLPGESYGLRILVGYSLWGHSQIGRATNTFSHDFYITLIPVA